MGQYVKKNIRIEKIYFSPSRGIWFYYVKMIIDKYISGQIYSYI